MPFLTALPDDLRFVLALHEASVVGLATGWALGRGEPALAVLHTTAGLGNAVGALATARVNRAPLVVLGAPATLTAILVVNWQLLTGASGRSSPWAWTLPTLVGSPIIAWVNVQIRRGRRPKLARPTMPR